MSYTYIGDLLHLRPREGQELVLRTFRRMGCNVSETARALGVGRPAFYHLVGVHGLKEPMAAAKAQFVAMRRL